MQGEAERALLDERQKHPAPIERVARFRST